MPDSHLKFHSSNGKRRVLIIDDEAINREILGNILEEQYEILFASTGAQALSLLRQEGQTLSLVLLDLLLPDMHGMDILRQMKSEPSFSALPVIVMTADKEAEVESLTIGAIDFISKPYPVPKVILARVLRTIELSETRDIISSTERDHLTGLYNKEYFYRYAQQYDLFHKDKPMDAIVMDINHFHMINERYGRAYGDEVLRRAGEKVREMVTASEGLVCRREADTFLVYCPHRTDYSAFLEEASAGLSGDNKTDSRVRLRMGVYSDVDKTLDVERRFDRAKMAADTVRSSFTKGIAVYDNKLHDLEIFEEQLLEGFHTAIAQKQFQVYFQPKFDIRQEEPVLSSAEALVRWQHPELGMINPGIFIPLFENNGLIQELDSYVWREAAAHMKDWKERLHVCVPVSVNVSRVDMYDPDMVANTRKLVEEYGLEPSELLLEITESAYTQDSEQIIETVTKLREAGFRIEMDDFGTGYSSLNMISSLPIDALKLDMQFIRNAFKERKDTRILEVVIEIAESLGVPTIAEGVETAEQLFTLRAMGCDIAQGYFFSRPVPAQEYEEFLKKKALKDTPSGAVTRKTAASVSVRKPHEIFTYNALHDPVTGLYNYSAYEMLLQDADKEHIAVLIADIEHYEGIRERIGENAAEQVVRRVAEVLRQCFRSVDFVCRTGENEFVVVLTRVISSMESALLGKISMVNAMLKEPTKDVPAVTLRVGAAFADRKNPGKDIFYDAETALRKAQTGKEGSIVFYGDEE